MSSAHHHTQHTPSIKDMMVFTVATALLFGAIGYFFFVDYAQEDDTYQLPALIGGIFLSMLVAYQSHYGRQLWHFFTEARLELRRIVWPDRQSAMVSSALVFVLVLFAGIYFWLLDNFFRWAIWSLLGFE